VAVRSPGALTADNAEPRLAIVIVADGLAWDTFDRYRDVYTSGLKRLSDEGRVEAECRYRNTFTETGPGHASIATGAPPRVHGIVANEWWQEERGAWRKVYCADEPGRPGVRGAGRLAAPTLGDRLVAPRPGARVVTVAGKDRAAILLAGRDPRHAPFWYDTKTGTFATAPVYDGASPAQAVVARFNAAHGASEIEARYGRTWSRTAGRRPAREPATDLAAAQDPAVGLGFDHDLGAAKGGLVRGLMWSPIADEIVADLVVALLEDDDLALGRRGVPDLLAVSFSGLDYVSHSYGNESEEAFEVLRRLDATIGRVLASAERRVGRGRVLVALSADHGFSPFPETWRRRDPASVAARLDVGAVRAKINAALERTLALPAGSAPVGEFDGFGLVWSRPALAALGSAIAPAATRDRALAAAATAVLGDSIEAAFPAAEGGPPPWGAFASEAFYEGRSPDVFVFPRTGVVPDWWNGKGSTHGSHHDYDAHVPLVFWGPGFERGVSTAPSTPCDIAPALARALGVTLE
jgi:arylsulfatase A-like enzyme